MNAMQLVSPDMPRPAGALSPLAHASVDDLTWLNIADIFRALRLPRTPWLRGVLELLCRRAARRFAIQVATVDHLVGSAGLSAGGAWICGQLADGIELRGALPPIDGPLLVVSNHPGLLDAAALFVCLPRPDLRVLAARRPFLNALPNSAAVLLSVGETSVERSAAVRAAVHHLRAGGALLNFPAGRIEPDPLALPGAIESLAGWSASIDLFARHARELTIVPAIVAGVFHPAALSHFLIHLHRSRDDRQWLAAILQLMYPERYRTCVRVSFGRPIRAGAGPASPLVIAEARRLIEELAPMQNAKFGQHIPMP